MSQILAFCGFSETHLITDISAKSVRGFLLREGVSFHSLLTLLNCQADYRCQGQTRCIWQSLTYLQSLVWGEFGADVAATGAGDVAGLGASAF